MDQSGSRRFPDGEAAIGQFLLHLRTTVRILVTLRMDLLDLRNYLRLTL
jgi:hypothetical protein